jgi:hypothetical protein
VSRAAGFRRRVWIVTKQILRAQLAIDAIKHCVELLKIVEDKERSTRAIGDCNERMFAGGIAAVLIFHGPDDDRIKQSARPDCRAPRVVKLRNARRLPAIGN